MKKNLIFKSLLIFVFVFTYTLSFGQAPSPCNDPMNPNPDFPDCDPDIEVPIDDGVYFILAAGVLIGYTLLRREKAEVV